MDSAASQEPPATGGTLEEAEAIARGVQHLNPWVSPLLAELDRLRSELAYRDQVIDERQRIIDVATALVATFNKHADEDEAVIDWDLLDLLVAEVRY